MKLWKPREVHWLTLKNSSILIHTATCMTKIFTILNNYMVPISENPSQLSEHLLQPVEMQVPPEDSESRHQFSPSWMLLSQTTEHQQVKLQITSLILLQIQNLLISTQYRVYFKQSANTDFQNNSII